MSNKDTSTLQSYTDSATGAIQSALGGITGNTADQASGENKQQQAQNKHEASHTAAKLGPYSASSSGAVTKDDPNRGTGSWNQTAGAGKEFIGGIVGSENLKQQGREQNADGKAQEAKGQLNDLGSGFTDRVQGAVGGAVAGVTGDREAQLKAQEQHDAGKTQQRGAELDIQKQNP